MVGYASGGVPLTLALLGGLAVAIFAPGPAQAQCRPGDVLVGEDDDYWYCAPQASSNDIDAIVKKLIQFVDEGSPQFLGEEWRLRKTVIDTAGCMARNAVAYSFGARITVPEQCLGRRELGIDCSGLVAYAARYSACAINGFWRASFNTLRALEDSAAGQAELFRKRSAFLPPTAMPTPGDTIFFAGTYDRNEDGTVDDKDGVTHVAIFLGRGADGTDLMIHASSSATRVVITPMPTNLAKKVVGYGNVSRLYLNLNTQ
jgi:hypothetical protein